ncbi:MAG: alpha/beta fold hydrolase, partial [Pseudomonadota bacterium]
LALLLLGCLLAHQVQTAGGVRMIDVRFVGSGGTAMSGLLHIPPNATRKTPAPGVLAVHGYFNSRETQGDFAIEFARRGYVVLALDQTGHGYSDPPAFANGFGGADGLRFLRGLDIVDKNNIGLEGHSMGGWAVVNAAAAIPDGYKAIVLAGSSTGAPFAPEGTAVFPRNMAVIFAKFDEFAPTMWGVPLARDVPQSIKLQTAFGTQSAVEPGRLYGSVDTGTGRMLFQPGGTHPWNHLSQTAIGDAVSWFQRTLDGGTKKPPQDQIWMWKELGTTIALAGFVVLVLGLFEVFLRFPYFAPLAAQPVATASARTFRWWTTLVFGALLPAVTLFPFMQVGASFVPASKLLPQAFANEILVWALLNAALIALLGLLPGGSKLPVKRFVGRATLLAVLTVAVSYVAVVLVNAMFQVDLRYWFIAFRPMGASQVDTFALYALPFALFFSVSMRALHANLSVSTHSPVIQYLVNVVALAAGFVVFLAVQYGLLFSGHSQLSFYMNDALRTIVAINFVPLMVIAALISTFTWRRTGSYLPGALICALLVAWYVVVGQATQVGP